MKAVLAISVLVIIAAVAFCIGEMRQARCDPQLGVSAASQPPRTSVAAAQEGNVSGGSSQEQRPLPYVEALDARAMPDPAPGSHGDAQAWHMYFDQHDAYGVYQRFFADAKVSPAQQQQLNRIVVDTTINLNLAVIEWADLGKNRIDPGPLREFNAPVMEGAYAQMKRVLQPRQWEVFSTEIGGLYELVARSLYSDQRRLIMLQEEERLKRKGIDLPRTVSLDPEILPPRAPIELTFPQMNDW